MKVKKTWQLPKHVSCGKGVRPGYGNTEEAEVIDYWLQRLGVMLLMFSYSAILLSSFF